MTAFTRPTVAWMGGCRPNPIANISQEERLKTSELFREQMQIFYAYWGVYDWDMARLFWKRARYDAHSTYRK